MLRRSKTAIGVVSGKELGEHEALARLHEARKLKARADEAVSTAERLMVDADAELAEARREVRRASER